MGPSGQSGREDRSEEGSKESVRFGRAEKRRVGNTERKNGMNKATKAGSSKGAEEANGRWFWGVVRESRARAVPEVRLGRGTASEP